MASKILASFIVASVVAGLPCAALGQLQGTARGVNKGNDSKGTSKGSGPVTVPSPAGSGPGAGPGSAYGRTNTAPSYVPRPQPSSQPGSTPLPGPVGRANPSANSKGTTPPTSNGSGANPNGLGLVPGATIPSSLNDRPPRGHPVTLGELLREKMILDKLFENRRRLDNAPAGGVALLPGNRGVPTPVRPPGMRSAWFGLYLTKVRVNQQTSDDVSGDGPGDEVFVRCALGQYSKSQSSFAVVTSYKTKLMRGLHTKEEIVPDVATSLICAPELVAEDHILVIAPTVWEQDEVKADDDGLTDRATAFHELVMSLEEDIGRHVRGIRKGESAYGLNKRGESFGFPFVSGTEGSNRPIGMTRTKAGRLEFSPKLIIADLQEATDLAGKANFALNFKDDPALGGNYTLEFKLVPVQ